MNVQKSGLELVMGLYEPYQSFLSVFMSNTTVSIAGEHRSLKWQTGKSLNGQITYLLPPSFLSFTRLAG